MSVKAKAIPTGNPVTASGRIPTPPLLGPLDGSHWWSARSLRGGTATPTSCPDMLGGLDLTQSGTGTWNFVDASPPSLVSTGGYWLQATAPASDRTADRTILFAGSMHVNNRQQIQVPGYSPIGVASASSLYVAGTTLTTGTLSSTPYVLMLVFSSLANTVKASINGGAWVSGALPTLGTTTLYRLGAQATSSNADVFVHLETWQRAVSDTEAATITNDARKLYLI